MKQKVLITGCAGFIGFHVSRRLIKEGYNVFGIDNLNDYYDTNLKTDRLIESGFTNVRLNDNKEYINELYDNYRFQKVDLANKFAVRAIFQKYEGFDYVIHLAAQAGVRYSINHPEKYIESNIIGFHNILEESQKYDVKHFIYASSSSVYGLNTEMPLSTNQKVDNPINIYAVSKKTNELMAHSYSSLHKIPTTGLRFFTVYGPWGRPDMAISLFADAISKNIPIQVFNNGLMERDFTYIDDIVEAIVRIIPHVKLSVIPYQVFNIGNGKPVSLLTFIELLEKYFEKSAIKNFQPMQKGDIIKTWADTSDLELTINFKPKINIEEGVKKFVEWFKEYYNV